MKLSKYNVIIEREYGLLLYNSRTTKYVKFYSKDDIEHLNSIVNNKIDPNDDMVQALYSRGFIVNKDCNEFLEAKKDIEEYFRLRESRYYFMIYVTENCNFRCIYCPQKHKHQSLTEENWDAFYTFIEKQVKNELMNELNISFFGGEPLLEFNNIYKFLKKLNDLQNKYPNLKLEHDITTNGYLLTPKIYDILVEHNIKAFQITIDGFAETHDIMRPRADGAKTWDTIIKNIEYINKKNDNIKIILRTNFNHINKNSMQNFYQYINDKFSNNKFIFDIQPVSDFSENVKNDLVDNSNKNEKTSLYNNIKKFPRSKENTMNPLRKLSSICKCAYKNSYTISSEGFITKCEHCYDEISYSIGKLDKNQGIKFNSNIKEWQNNFELEECAECYIYPLCAARSCPARKVFDPLNRSDCFQKEINTKQIIIDTIKNGIFD